MGRGLRGKETNMIDKFLAKMDEMIEWANQITTEEEYEEFCEEEAKMLEDIRIVFPNKTEEWYDLWCKRINEVVWNISADDRKPIMENKKLLPGHYYRGAEGVVVKVFGRSPSGKTVYITTHSDDDNPCLQTKRVKVDDCGNEYICYKKGNYVVGSWNETDWDSFRRYLMANIGKPCAVI